MWCCLEIKAEQTKVMDPTGEKVPCSLIITRCGPNKKCVQTEESFRVEEDQWPGARLY